jgi:hypothetical protein
MGSAHYLQNPSVLICPFEGDKCKHAKHRLNRVAGISQLYSHWQSCHKENPAARVLEKRWRTVLQLIQTLDHNCGGTRADPRALLAALLHLSAKCQGFVFVLTPPAGDEGAHHPHREAECAAWPCA